MELERIEENAEEVAPEKKVTKIYREKKIKEIIVPLVIEIPEKVGHIKLRTPPDNNNHKAKSKFMRTETIRVQKDVEKRTTK